jgi:hypothetical protein
LDLILEAQQSQRFQISSRIALEALLLRIIRSHQRISLDQLFERLDECEKKLPQAVESKPEKQTPAFINSPQDLAEQGKGRQLPGEFMKTAENERTSVLQKVAPQKPSADVNITARHETLLQFAAVEFSGRIERTRI